MNNNISITIVNSISANKIYDDYTMTMLDIYNISTSTHNICFEYTVEENIQNDLFTYETQINVNY